MTSILKGLTVMNLNNCSVRSFFCLTLLAIIVLFLPIFAGNTVLIQPTRSFARGLYLKIKIEGKPDLNYGDIVSVSFKDNDLTRRMKTQNISRYPLPQMLPWHTFIKVIYGIPGDRISVTKDGCHVNGKYLGPVIGNDPDGRKLPGTMDSEYRLKEDWYFVSTPHRRSFDSRYFGPVHITQMALANPLWLLPSDNHFLVERKRLWFEKMRD